MLDKTYEVNLRGPLAWTQIARERWMGEHGVSVINIASVGGFKTSRDLGFYAIFKAAPNPFAARLMQNYMLSAECQQLIINEGGLRSAHKLTKDKPGRTPLSQIKLLKDDAAGVEKQSTEIKARYTKIFKV